MFARTVDADDKQDDYIAKIIQTLTSQPLNHLKPADFRVLQTLLAAYINESGSSYLGFKFNNHTQARTAADCLNELALDVSPNKTTESAILGAINIINNTSKINPEGHFAKLISLYFSIFRTYYDELNEKTKALIKDHDLWSTHYKNWVHTFMRAVSSNQLKHYEMLDQVAQTVPIELLGEYKTFLLSELASGNRYEQQTGLHRGWVCAALGSILPDLASYEKNEVIKTLIQVATNPSDNLTIIGACFALSLNSTLLDARQNKTIANRIYQYCMDQLFKQKDFFASHQPETLRTYMLLLFDGLRNMQNYISEASKKSIMSILTDANLAYTLKDGLAILQDWLDDESKMQFINSLSKQSVTTDSHYLELLHMLWNWFDDDSNKNNAWSKSRHLNKVFEEASALLCLKRYEYKDEFDERDDLLLNAKIVLLKPMLVKTNERFRILDNLYDAATKNHNKTIRANALNALATLKDWIPPKYRKNWAESLYEIALDETEMTLKLIATSTVLSLRDNLYQSQVNNMRDILLNAMDSDNVDIRHQANQLIKTYANEAPTEELPALMTLLMVKKSSPFAQALLPEILDDYRQALRKVNSHSI